MSNQPTSAAAATSTETRHRATLASPGSHRKRGDRSCTTTCVSLGSDPVDAALERVAWDAPRASPRTTSNVEIRSVVPRRLRALPRTARGGEPLAAHVVEVATVDGSSRSRTTTPPTIAQLPALCSHTITGRTCPGAASPRVYRARPSNGRRRKSRPCRGRGAPKSISSHASWPTSPMARSPVSRSNENRHGFAARRRTPRRARGGRGTGCAPGDRGRPGRRASGGRSAAASPTASRGPARCRARRDGRPCHPVTGADVEQPIRPERELPAVVVGSRSRMRGTVGAVLASARSASRRRNSTDPMVAGTIRVIDVKAAESA